jgi:tetratricopeptide (TPR) repeat protein
MNARKGPAAVGRRVVVYPKKMNAGSARSLLHGAWPVLAVAVLAFLLYLPTLGATFVWDDLDLIVRNRDLHAFEWWKLATTDYWHATGGGTGMWRPLVILSFAVDGAISHFDPAWFHLVNALAYSASAAALTLLARRWSGSAVAAIVAGAWFALLPAHAEAVAWIAGRTDVFATLFTLLALLALPRSRGVALVCAALAMLSKETAFVLPLLVLLAARAEDEALDWRGAFARALPFVALAGVLALAHHACADPVRADAAARFGITQEAGQRAAAAVLLFLHVPYLWPWAGHSPLLHWAPPAPLWSAAAWLALTLVLALLVRWALLPARRLAAGALALAVLPMLPLAAAVFLEGSGRLAERSLLLPSAGIALLLALGLAALAQQPARARLAPLATVALALLAIGGGIASVPQVAVWHDDLTRASRVAASDPRDADANLGLADQLASQGRFVEAEAQLAEAGRRAPGSAAVRAGLAGLRYRQGAFADALAEADAALAIDPHSLGGQLLHVKSLLRLQRASEALEFARDTWSHGGGGAPAMAAYGEALLANGRDSAAVTVLRRAADELPGDGELTYALGVAAARAGNLAQAREAFGRCVDAQPQNYTAWLLLAGTCHKLGDDAGCERALTVAASLPEASDGRAAAMRQQMLPGR